MTFSEWFGEWYRARLFAAEKAAGRAEGRAAARAEAIKLLKDRGFYAAAAMLEAPAPERSALREPHGDR